VHQAFVALFRNRERVVSDNDGLYRYLLVAARRSSLDRLKTARLRESRRADLAARGAALDAGDQSSIREKNEAIREIFCELGELDRLILWSHVVDGQSINAIARELDLNWHRVSQAIERAIRRIRRRIKD
jgi:RNA polymerase sigma factor (sigma-70 family)